MRFSCLNVMGRSWWWTLGSSIASLMFFPKNKFCIATKATVEMMLGPPDAPITNLWNVKIKFFITKMQPNSFEYHILKHLPCFLWSCIDNNCGWHWRLRPSARSNIIWGWGVDPINVWLVGVSRKVIHLIIQNYTWLGHDLCNGKLKADSYWLNH